MSYFLFTGFFNRYLLQQDSGSGVLTEYIFCTLRLKKLTGDESCQTTPRFNDISKATQQPVNKAGEKSRQIWLERLMSQQPLGPMDTTLRNNLRSKSLAECTTDNANNLANADPVIFYNCLLTAAG